VLFGAHPDPTVTDVHPYVMLKTIFGKLANVMNWHTTGSRSFTNSGWPPVQGENVILHAADLGETASVFGEMLTFRKMLDGAKPTQNANTAAASRRHDQHGRAPDFAVL